MLTISKKRKKEIEALRDEDIDYSDIPETDAAFWESAEIQMPEPKQGVYIRLDADILDWLKKEGKGYQTRINAILRTYYEAHKNNRP